MASANLELIRSLYEAWARGESRSIGTEWADPEIEFVIADGPTPGTWKGLAGMAEGWKGFLSAWEEFRPEVDEYPSSTRSVCSCCLVTKGAGKQAGSSLVRSAQRERPSITSAAAR